MVDGFADVEENGGGGEVVREARTIEGEAEAPSDSEFLSFLFLVQKK